MRDDAAAAADDHHAAATATNAVPLLVRYLGLDLFHSEVAKRLISIIFRSFVLFLCHLLHRSLCLFLLLGTRMRYSRMNSSGAVEVSVSIAPCLSLFGLQHVRLLTRIRCTNREFVPGVT